MSSGERALQVGGSRGTVGATAARVAESALGNNTQATRLRAEFAKTVRAKVTTPLQSPSLFEPEQDFLSLIM